jgi:hypothetical protein
MAIVIIGIALGVFVLTAAARAFRRSGRQADRDEDGDAGETGETKDAGLTGPDPAYGDSEADNVEPERAGRSPAAKEPGDHASTRAGRSAAEAAWPPADGGATG